jgi:hypothetical protein
MSAPARKLTAPRPHAPRRTGEVGGVARGRAQPVHKVEPPLRSRPRAAPRPKRRKQHRLGFAVFASALVGSMILAIVVVHALLAQQSFRIVEAERGIEELAGVRLELVRAQASLSAPDRIAAWATRHDMRLPDDIRILRAPDGPADPAGAGITSDARNVERALRSETGGRPRSPAEDG